MSFSQSLGPSALVDGILDRMIDERRIAPGLNWPRATEIAAAAGQDTLRLHELSSVARTANQEVWDSVFVDQARVQHEVRESLVLMIVSQTPDASLALPYILGALEAAEGRIELLARDAERRMTSIASELASSSADRFIQTEAVVRGRPYLNVLSADTVYFALGADSIAAPQADALAEWARRFTASRFTFSVVGSADPTGSVLFNHMLSERRANAVVKLLVERAGIPPARLSAVSVGATSTDPLVERNRRVIVAVHGVPDT